MAPNKPPRYEWLCCAVLYCSRDTINDAITRSNRNSPLRTCARARYSTTSPPCTEVSHHPDILSFYPVLSRLCPSLLHLASAGRVSAGTFVNVLSQSSFVRLAFISTPPPSPPPENPPPLLSDSTGLFLDTVYYWCLIPCLACNYKNLRDLSNWTPSFSMSSARSGARVCPEPVYTYCTVQSSQIMADKPSRFY